jgi:hypothetical protein
MPSAGELDGNPDPDIRTLASGKGSAIEISRSVVQLVSRRVAGGIIRDTLAARDIDNLKHALEELRKAEGDYIDLEERRRNLIPRSEVLILLGEAVNRLVGLLGIVENSIGTEFSLWLADPAVKAMTADERARKVREFVARTCNEVRRAEADGVEAMLDNRAVV